MGESEGVLKQRGGRVGAGRGRERGRLQDYLDIEVVGLGWGRVRGYLDREVGWVWGWDYTNHVVDGVDDRGSPYGEYHVVVQLRIHDYIIIYSLLGK